MITALNNTIKPLLLALIIVLTNHPGFSQNTDQDALREAVIAYQKAVENQDIAQTLDFIHPALFEKMPKEKLQEAMEKMNQDSTMRVNVTNSNIESISKILKVKGSQYASVKTTFELHIDILEKDFDAAAVDFMIPMFEVQYGKGNVSFAKEQKRFIISTNNEIYAIREPGFDNWKFLEKKEKLKTIFVDFLPKKVLKKL